MTLDLCRSPIEFCVWKTDVLPCSRAAEQRGCHSPLDTQHIMNRYPRLSRVLLVAGLGALLTSAVSATWAIQQPDASAAPDARDNGVSAPAFTVVALGH